MHTNNTVYYIFVHQYIFIPQKVETDKTSAVAFFPGQEARATRNSISAAFSSMFGMRKQSGLKQEGGSASSAASNAVASSADSSLQSELQKTSSDDASIIGRLPIYKSHLLCY